MRSVRDRVERAIRRPLSDDQWSVLEEKGFVGELDYSMPFEELVDVARRITNQGKTASGPRKTTAPLRTPAPPMTKTKKSPTWDRTYALAETVALLAAEDDDVKRFRAQVLGGVLIPWADLESWISKVLVEEDGPTGYITVALPPGTTIDTTAEGHKVASPPLTEFRHGIRRETPLLTYARPGDRWVKVVTPVIGGKLDWLKRLSKSLRLYGWSEAQAVIFVICGVPPLIEPIVVRQAGLAMRNRMPITWGRRITMEIDPTSTPAQVEAAYRHARNDMGLKNYRGMERKHLELATFYSKSDEKTTWRGLMKEWNNLFPQWRYSQESNFRRDAGRAQLRLLEPGTCDGRARPFQVELDSQPTDS